MQGVNTFMGAKERTEALINSEKREGYSQTIIYRDLEKSDADLKIL